MDNTAEAYRASLIREADEQLKIKLLEYASRNPNHIAMEVVKEMYEWVKQNSDKKDA